MTTDPLVTLVIPSYNPGSFLAQTLDSVSKQTLQNYECLVVDDGSTDGSLKYFTAERQKNKRLSLIKHKVQSGVSAARNSGIRAAKGRFIAFLDADDLLMPNSLEVRARTCLAALDASEAFAGSYCASRTIEEKFKGTPQSEGCSLQPIGFASNGPACPFNANQPMIRADILRKSGGFDEGMSQSEDYDLWLRILRAGYWFAPSNHVAVTYRKRTASQVRKAPMVHLHAAIGLLDSGEKQLPEDCLTWSSRRLHRPYSDYAIQQRKLNRILEFCGMNIGSPEPEPVDAICRLLANEIPDARHITPPNQEISRRLIAGITRQTGAPPTAEQAEVAEEVLSKFLSNEAASNSSTVSAPNCDHVFSRSKWSSASQAQIDIVFLPHKDYHVWTIGLLREEMERRGLSFTVVDLSPQWREAGVRKTAQEQGLPLVGLSDFVLGAYRPRQVVVFNDWDSVTRPIVAAAKAAGIATTAIVEGIQDYDDADVHWTREAYQLAQTVLLPGDFDRRYFRKPEDEQKTITVGVARIQTLRNKGPKPTLRPDEKPRILINSNFSYGVLEADRDAWVKGAVAAVKSVGMVPVISRHPADTGTLFPELVTDEDFYTCLERCQGTIQRFASGVLEALARDTPVFYFNPHGEKVDKFTHDPMGAYPVVKSSEDLKSELRDLDKWKSAVAENAPRFLDAHTGKADSDIFELTVDGLVQAQGKKATDDQMIHFKKLMRGIDQASMALCQAIIGGVQLIPTLSDQSGLMAGFLAKAEQNDPTKVIVKGSSNASASVNVDAQELSDLVRDLKEILRPA